MRRRTTLPALTLHRPWPGIIVHGATLLDGSTRRVIKRVENRTWAPPAWMRDRTFALHAGKAWACRGGASTTLRIFREVERLEVGAPDRHPTGIVATARVWGVIVDTERGPEGWSYNGSDFTPSRPPRRLPQVDTNRLIDRFYEGPVAWLLAEVRPLRRAIPCRGRQGVWWLPADVDAEVRREVRGVGAL